MSFWLWFALVIVKGDGAGKYCVGMCIFLFRNLKSRIKRDFLLRSSSGGQFNDCNIFVILSLWFLLHGLFNTNLAARCCIISSLWMDVCWYGSHIVEQYSMDGNNIPWHCFISEFSVSFCITFRKKTCSCGSQVGHIWVTSRLLCGLVGQWVWPTLISTLDKTIYKL